MSAHENATRAVLSLHCKFGNRCVHCAETYPCVTVQTVMDAMAGSVVEWFA